MLSRRHLLCSLGGLAASATMPRAAHGAFAGLQGPLPPSSEMSSGKLIPAPSAWFALLRDHPELDPARTPFAPVSLSGANAAALIKVNKEINAKVQFRDDAQTDFWRIGYGEGDCEDFAIRKLVELTGKAGLPRGALTIAACRLDYDRGHAVLLVHTDRGVYVMDNLSPRVLPWHRLPYRWVAREEPGAPFRLWRSLQG